ncbi:DUF6134 family protein [Mesonia ostreae]|uniref:DUF6134 family protein n=1 Tax=Mesonia ostreae TaxID=861110 RepID=A0ABU2KL77_9FLAO|nr:DUF6134 family protein [Mesonia ostreae]MDT0295437.1 DUF6134 family protein [Mesonia ostreae]
MFKRTFILIFLLMLGYFSAFSQTQSLTYQLFYHKKEIGTLKVTKIVEGNRSIYQNQTHINTRILFSKIVVDYSYLVVFNKKKLSNAKVLIEVKGDKRSDTQTILKDGIYQYYEDQKLINELKSDITYSAVMLMLEEPVGIHSVYSEENGTFHSLKKIGEHVYEKTNDKNNVNEYAYKNGVLESGTINAGIISFSMKLIDE